MGLLPGSVFTHRNIANIINHKDTNTAAVIEYSVGVMKDPVKEIIVCGHTNCGGVKTVLKGDSVGPILDTWLSPLKQIRDDKRTMLQAQSDGGELELAELNVKAGVENVKLMPVVSKAMKDRKLIVKGVVYDVGTGVLREISTA